MFLQTSNGANTIDPNMARAIEELAHAVNEVEQRIQYVKLGLIQSFPHLALNAPRNPFTVGVPTGLPANLVPTNLLPTNLLSANLSPASQLLLSALTSGSPWGLTPQATPFGYILPQGNVNGQVVTTPFGTYPSASPATFRF